MASLVMGVVLIHPSNYLQVWLTPNSNWVGPNFKVKKQSFEGYIILDLTQFYTLAIIILMPKL